MIDRGGDPERSLELLWRKPAPPRRGPRPKLDLDQIVRAAIEIADAEGLDPLSMRKVAERIGVATMSLYTYVPGKTELLDLMFDAAAVSPAELATGTWRERLERIAHANWWRYHRHPWMLEIAMVRPVLGPNVVARHDQELAAVDGIGLTDVEMGAVVSLLAGHVEGAARRSLEAGRAPILARLVDPGRFPVAVRVSAATADEHNAGYAPEHAFEFGLERILDGVEALIRRRSLDD